MQMGQSETAADKSAVANKSLDLPGRRVCSYVEVLGGSIYEQVAYTPPHQISEEPVVMEPIECA